MTSAVCDPDTSLDQNVIFSHAHSAALVIAMTDSFQFASPSAVFPELKILYNY